MNPIDEFAKRSGAWLSGKGPLSDVVISSRIRLARNLANFHFLSKTDEGQRRSIYRVLYEKISQSNLGFPVMFVDIDETADLDRRVLVERHLISRQHAEGEGSRPRLWPS